MFRKYFFFILIPFFLFINNPSFAESTSGLIDKGNKSWVAGDYDEAIKNYDEAAVDSPESPYIYFNKGTALYKKGDFNAAIDEFEKAALKSKKPEMEAKSRYNMGDCTFREAEKQMDSDLKKSLELCQKSLLHYQDSLKLDPGFKKAAENIEIVRLYMKNILDEIKKREEEAKQQEQQSKENSEDLQKLIKRQENALEKNKQISGSKTTPDEKKNNLNRLADEQKTITDDTQKLADKIKAQSSKQNQGGENPALTHLNNAVKEQEAAEGNLRNSEGSFAKENQQNAINEMKEALKPPDKDRNKQQQGDKQKEEGQQEQQQGKQGQQKDQDKQKNEEPSQDQNQSDKEEQAELQKSDKDAQNILDEEKENRKQRRINTSGGYKDV